MTCNRRLLDDTEISQSLGVSKSWMRGQRHKRRHGLPHYLTIDPVMIGSMPRYRAEDFAAWIETPKPANDNIANENGGQS